MGDPTRFRLEDLAIDLERQRVERAGEVLNVAGLSFQLLRYLVLQGDRVVGFDELIERVWAPAVVNEETVTQRVKLLRQALGDDGRQPRYLRSVRGQGYQLCARPQPLDDDVEPVPKASFAASRRWSRAAVAVVIVTAVAVGLAIAWTSGDVEKKKTNATASSVPSGASGTASLIERADYYAGIGQRDNNERAIELYERALREQPDNARALVGLSRSYGARVCLFNFPPEWAARAQQLAERVIHAHPDQAAAYAALGYSHDCRGRIDEALAGYERAVALDPAADGSRASARRGWRTHCPGTARNFAGTASRPPADSQAGPGCWRSAVAGNAPAPDLRAARCWRSARRPGAPCDRKDTRPRRGTGKVSSCTRTMCSPTSPGRATCSGMAA